MFLRSAKQLLGASAATLRALGAASATAACTAARGSGTQLWADDRLPFHSSAVAMHGPAEDPNAETIQVTFSDEKDGTEKTVAVPLGQNLLEAAHSNDIDLEGACEGSLACSTCHVIVEDPDYFARMPEPDDDENDMLDLAFGLTDTSRLGCQVKAAKDLEGLHVRIPSATRNFAVDKQQQQQQAKGGKA